MFKCYLGTKFKVSEYHIINNNLTDNSKDIYHYYVKRFYGIEIFGKYIGPWIEITRRSYIGKAMCDEFLQERTYKINEYQQIYFRNIDTTIEFINKMYAYIEREKKIKQKLIREEVI